MTSPNDSKTKAIARYIEEAIRAIYDAMNQRPFNPNADAFQVLSPDFNMCVEHFSPKELTREEYLSGYKKLTIDHPEYQARLVDISTDVNDKLGHADVFLNVESRGLRGVTQRSTGLSEFRRIDGQWLCVKHRGIRGTDPAGV